MLRAVWLLVNLEPDNDMKLQLLSQYALSLHRALVSYFLILLSSGMLRRVGWCSTDVSGLHTDSIFKGQAVQEDPWPLNMGHSRSPETSLLNQSTLHNIPEDSKI
jgi:hypothetical protein